MKKKIKELLDKLRGKIRELSKTDVNALIKKKISSRVKTRKDAVMVIAVLLGITVAIALLLIFYVRHTQYKLERLIKVSGNIEGTEVRLAFRVEGQITELLTDEGMVIRVGDVVARLDKDEWSKKQKEAEAALTASEYEHRLARDDYTRAQNLFNQGSLSEQELETYQTKAESTNAIVNENRAALELTNTRLGFTDLASPLNGFVLTKSAEAGEVVHVGATVVTAIDLSDIWVTAYLNERDLGKVKLNQKAFVKIDSFPLKKYNGWVSYISQEAEFTPKYIQTTTERVKMVYRIKVRVDNSSLELKPGMPADAYIITQR